MKKETQCTDCWEVFEYECETSTKYVKCSKCGKRKSIFNGSMMDGQKINFIIDLVEDIFEEHRRVMKIDELKETIEKLTLKRKCNWWEFNAVHGYVPKSYQGAITGRESRRELYNQYPGDIYEAFGEFLVIKDFDVRKKKEDR